jgi:hypothetical protein
MTLFIITKLWNQPKCPSMDELINKMWYIYIYGSFSIYIRKFFSAIKKSEIMSFAGKWMEPPY